MYDPTHAIPLMHGMDTRLIYTIKHMAGSMLGLVIGGNHSWIEQHVSLICKGDKEREMLKGPSFLGD